MASGGAREGSGRKKLENKKNKLFLNLIKCTEEEKKELENSLTEYAKRINKTKADALREIILNLNN